MWRQAENPSRRNGEKRLALGAGLACLLSLVLFGIVPQELGGHGVDVAGLGHAFVAGGLEVRGDRLELARVGLR